MYSCFVRARDSADQKRAGRVPCVPAAACMYLEPGRDCIEDRRQAEEGPKDRSHPNASGKHTYVMPSRPAASGLHRGSQRLVRELPEGLSQQVDPEAGSLWTETPGAPSSAPANDTLPGSPQQAPAGSLLCHQEVRGVLGGGRGRMREKEGGNQTARETRSPRAAGPARSLCAQRESRRGGFRSPRARPRPSGDLAVSVRCSRCGSQDAGQVRGHATQSKGARSFPLSLSQS